MSRERQGGIAALGLVLLLVCLWVFWGSGQWQNRQQNEVLAELNDVVEQASTTETPASETAGADPTASEPTTTVSAVLETSTTEAEPTASTATEPAATEPATTEPAATEPATTEPDVATAAATSTTETTTSSEAPADSSSTTETPSSSSTTETPTPTTEAATSTTTAVSRTPAVASFEVIETIPHDTEAFTQGLEISNGRLFESTGLVGRSSIRELDLATGEVVRITAVPNVFGEGLTIVGDTAIQITWQDQVAFRYDLDTFDVIDTYEYDGQGWGLCLASEGDGNLVMSNGSSELQFRDPDTFELLDSVDVLLDGSPIENLNELECIGDTVWANIWLSSLVIEIDPTTGNVLTVLDIDELRPESTDSDSGAVWNGLAYDPTDETLLVTGKLWPTIFRLELSTN